MKVNNGERDDEPDDFSAAFPVIKQPRPNGGDEPPDHDDGDDNDHEPRRTIEWKDKEDNSEFQLVNSRNIEVVKFAGSAGCKIPYIDFNDSMRKYMAIKGKDGEIVNRILTAAEKRGDEPIIDIQLQTLSKKTPKVWEYNRAIQSVLKNWDHWRG